MSHKLSIISKVNPSAYAKWGIVSSASRVQEGKAEERKGLGHGKTVHIYIKRRQPLRPTRDQSGITIARASPWLLIHRWLQLNFGPSVGAAPRDVDL